MIKRFHNNSRVAGFSLMELMVAIAIVAILSAAAIPGYINWREKYNLKSAARELYSYMQTVRINAAKGNTSWALIFNAVGNSYQLCSNRGADGDWTNGDWTTVEDNTYTQSINLGDSGVSFSHGGAVNDVAGNAFANNQPATNVTYTSRVAGFTGSGRSFEGNGAMITTPRYVYISNSSGKIAYAIGTNSGGGIRLLVWNGGGWQ
jgi:prepilin-type N-terminal cleavage/methylation domain-containing protein